MSEEPGRLSSLPGDPRFFQRSGPFSLAQIQDVAGASLPHGRDVSFSEMFEGIAPLQAATSRHVSFLDNRRYLPLLKETKAGAVILSRAFAQDTPETSVPLLCDHPYLSWSRVAQLFFPPPPAQCVQHRSAVIEDGAHLGQNVSVGAFSVIGRGARIGDHCVIGSHVSIGDHVEIGPNSRVGHHSTISHALMGEGVVLYPGVRIGQDGFGFAVGPEGFETIPQLGRVIIEDGVEVGANTTIDRGSMRDTVIGAGTRIDNLVQIGHNARLGRCCIVVSQAGISGSTEIDDFVTIAAQAGLIGHIHIGHKARIGAQCGVMSDVEAGADVIGSPAMPFREFFRNIATLRKLTKKGRS